MQRTLVNKLIEFFTSKGQFADVITIFILFVGIFAAVTIQREVFPNISYDIVTVSALFILEPRLKRLNA